MLTSSLGWTSSPASVASTSFAFMFEDVDGKLVVELARGDLVGRRRDPLRLVGVEKPELGVRARRGALDPAEPAGNGSRNRLSGDGKIRDRLRRLRTPELLLARDA